MEILIKHPEGGDHEFEPGGQTNIWKFYVY